jgi:hypothetical protein
LLVIIIIFRPSDSKQISRTHIQHRKPRWVKVH